VKVDKSKHDTHGQLKYGIFKELFKDGALSCVGEYRNGEKIGEWKYYLGNGLTKAVGRYDHGKMTDEWKWYCENGELMQTGSFDDEKKVGHLEEIPPQRSCMTRATMPTTKRSANDGPMTSKGS